MGAAGIEHALSPRTAPGTARGRTVCVRRTNRTAWLSEVAQPRGAIWPREESNLRTQIRSLPLYPLSYGAPPQSRQRGAEDEEEPGRPLTAGLLAGDS